MNLSAIVDIANEITKDVLERQKQLLLGILDDAAAASLEHICQKRLGAANALLEFAGRMVWSRLYLPGIQRVAVIPQSLLLPTRTADGRISDVERCTAGVSARDIDELRSRVEQPLATMVTRQFDSLQATLQELVAPAKEHNGVLGVTQPSLHLGCERLQVSLTWWVDFQRPWITRPSDLGESDHGPTRD